MHTYTYKMKIYFGSSQEAQAIMKCVHIYLPKKHMSPPSLCLPFDTKRASINSHSVRKSMVR